MPDLVAINEIPLVRTPGAFVTIENQTPGATNERHEEILVIAADATDEQDNVVNQITSTSDISGIYNRLSPIGRMLKAIINTEPTAIVSAVSLSPATLTKEKVTIRFVGTATADTTVQLMINGIVTHIKIGSGMIPALISRDINSKLITNYRISAVPVDVAGSLTITAIAPGYTNLDVRFINYQTEKPIPGIIITFTKVSATTTFTDANGIANLFATIGDKQYTTIICQHSDTNTIAALAAELKKRFSPLERKDGHAFIGVSSTHSNIIRLASLINSPHITLVCLNNSPTPTHIYAAIFAAKAHISSIIDPARQLTTLPLPGVVPPDVPDQFTRTERDLMLHGGVSTTTSENGIERISRAITTYTTDAQGLKNDGYLDVTTMRTISYVAYHTIQMVTVKYGRHKLADDGTNFAPGQFVVTAKILTAEVKALFREFERQGLIENIAQFEDEVRITRSLTDPNRINAIIPINIINQFRIFAASVRFTL